MDFKEESIKLLAKETKLSISEIKSSGTIPPNPKLGDFALPCFKLGKNPKEEAEKLKKNIKLPKFLSKIEVAGPYLNLFYNNKLLVKNTLIKINKEKNKYGFKKIGKNKKIIIDFSSPNIAKPFGIGHLRSTVIGNCLYKVFNSLGYQAISINHLGDWGTQFGKLIVAFKKWGKKEELQKNPIKHLLKLYVKFHQQAEKSNKLIEEAREEFKKLENNDQKTLKIWNLFRKLSFKEFKKIYEILDVKFNSNEGESFYNKMLDQTIKQIKQKTKTKISEGALIVDLEKYKLAPVLLKKSNGTTTYHTRDLAAALYRLKKYNPEKIIYVVGSEQKLHFEQLFKVLELIKIDIKKFVHIDFGLFRFPEGKMSTRKGNVIFLEDVLNKSIKLAEKIIKEKNPNLKNRKKVAQMIGVGSIIFADLSNDRIRNIDFNWDRMLSFEGETAPYLQYTHARCCSILKKSGININTYPNTKFDFSKLKEEVEINLVKLLYNYPQTLIKVSISYKPHNLAKYLISLGQLFNEFYHQQQVISEDKNLMIVRLLLVDSVRQVLENGLGLLGIKAPDEM